MLLGEYTFPKTFFEKQDAIFSELGKKEFAHLSERKKNEKVSLALYGLIEKAETPCFLLPAVLEFIARVDQGQILTHYTLSSFELWLNQYSGLGAEKNSEIRGKIAGKWIERSDYQVLFPVGMGKMYEGTHVVTAHRSPDLDTTVASFWGWLDAFAARVGDSLHIWNLPGGPPPSQIEIELMFKDVFGSALFTHVAKDRSVLNLTSVDLMKQKDLLPVPLGAEISTIDHGRTEKAVVVVGDDHAYLGDWREMDVEGVSQLVVLLGSFLRFFENQLYLKWSSLFAKKDLKLKEVEGHFAPLFSKKISEFEPASRLTLKQKERMNLFLIKVIAVKKGIDASFADLLERLSLLAECEVNFFSLSGLITEMEALFEKGGNLTEDRSRIFQFLEKVIQILHEKILLIRQRVEKLDIALLTKKAVFGHHPTSVNVRSDVEEVRAKMGNHHHLTVTHTDQEGNLSIAGVISAADFRKPFLGTVSLRDFCNRDEMGIPAYMEVISVIDHHKSKLQTMAPPFAFIADVQSSNTLVAECAFQINDLYSTSDQKEEEIDAQIKANLGKSSLIQRLLKKKEAMKRKGSFFIDPSREALEYLHFIYAILDDTDLLTKVSLQDVECVAALLNRLKSIVVKKEEEIIDLSDLPRDKHFPKKAAERILQNEEMYSLYRKVYVYRENEVEENLKLAADGKPTNIFADTKEQNGCCRIGQTKVFPKNITYFLKNVREIQKNWLEKAVSYFQEKKEVDLHIHMISTIVSAEEVYQGKKAKYTHEDEVWIWIPETEVAIERLKRFLTSFQNSPGLIGNQITVEFLGDNAEMLSQIFTESFIDVPHKKSKSNLPIAVIRIQPGTLNSRKAMISPYLPTILSE